MPEITDIMEKLKPEFDYKIIMGADHDFTGPKKELGNAVASWL